MAYLSEAERVKKHVRETLTAQERLLHWWHYHWIYAAVSAAALLLGVYFAAQALSNPHPDYTIGWVGTYPLSQEQEAAVAEGLAPFGEDQNGDGKICIIVRQYLLDLEAMHRRGMTNGEQEYASLLALEADLTTGQSGLFLTVQPAAFQQYSGALLYRDGSEPAEGAEDWENMVIPCGEGLYLGCRGCWVEGQQPGLDAARSLWCRFLCSGEKLTLHGI